MPYSVQWGGGHPHYKYSVKHVYRPKIFKKMKQMKISSRNGKGLLTRQLVKSQEKVEKMKSDISAL